MQLLLSISRAIDGFNGLVGRLVHWLVLVAVVISSGNAMVRYLFNNSSNAWLEVQWYLFSAVFLLTSGYTLLKNEHIRIDVIAGHLSRRTQVWIDVFGTIFFLMPMVLIILYLSWPMFWMSFQSGEVSSNAGGLVRWPAKILLPMGFSLLALQGLSELIKRVAYLSGHLPELEDDLVASNHAPPLKIEEPGERP